MESTSAEAGLPDVLNATPRGRLWLAALFILVFALIAAFQLFVFPQLTASLKSGPDTNGIFTLRIIFVGLEAIAVSTAAFVIWYGRQIMRRKQFPLPGAWVWNDTPIKRGPRAIKIAWLHFLTGAAICIMGIALAVYLWKGLDRSKPQYQLPKGVTIVR